MRRTRVPIAVLSALTAVFLPHFASGQMAPIFGPRRFARGNGPADNFTITFPHCGTGRQCRIVVVNGDENGDHRVGNGIVSLNGVEIAGAGAFRQAAGETIKLVRLGSYNQLAINLASEPGSFLNVRVECAVSPAVLAAGNASASLLNGRLVTKLPILNYGTAAAGNLRATAITLSGRTPATPPLPYELGTIPASGSAELPADFDGSFAFSASAVLEVSGTYSAAEATYCFALAANVALPSALPGTSVGTTTATPRTVSGGNFPHQPINFPESVNGSSRWKLPETGPTTFRTIPEGLQIAVDSSRPATTPFTIELAPGIHTISVPTLGAGPAGTRYRFTHWSDGGAASHQISGGTSGVTYTASFVIQYLLDVSATPPVGGRVTVTPPPLDGSGYYDAGSRLTVTARPGSGYRFDNFQGALTGPANPQTITLNAPAKVIAKFREGPQ